MNFIEINKLAKLKVSLASGIFMIAACLQFTPISLKSQPQNANSQTQALIDSAQNIYGYNDLLINGQIYYQPNRLASGTPYIFSKAFNDGTIFTRGISFNVIGLNYNIVDQKLILLNITPDNTKLHVKLSNILVDSFLLNGYLFVNTEELNISSNFPFMLLTNNGSYYFLIGFNKEYINRFSQNDPYGKFSSVKRTLFLVHNTALVNISSKRNFLKEFPLAKKEISLFLKKNKIKFSKATPKQLKHLIEFCNTNMKNNNE